MFKLKNLISAMVATFLIVSGLNFGIEMMAIQHEKSYLTFSFGLSVLLMFPVLGMFILYKQKR